MEEQVKSIIRSSSIGIEYSGSAYQKRPTIAYQKRPPIASQKRPAIAYQKRPTHVEVSTCCATGVYSLRLEYSGGGSEVYDAKHQVCRMS